MTTNLSVIANVKQLWNLGSFRILLPFFRTSWGVGVLNSAIFNSFHNRVKFGTILGGVWTPPPRYATAHGGNCRSSTPNPPTSQMLVNTRGMKIRRQLTQKILQNCNTILSHHVWKLLYILCTYSPVSFKINIVTSKLKSGHQLWSIVWFKTPIPGW